MLRFCSFVWDPARNMKSILAASVAAGAFTAPAILFAVSPDSTVTIFDFGFDPGSIPVTAGQSVTWTYPLGSTFHTVTADDGSFDSSLLMPGQTFSFTFLTPGVYSYHCSLHSFMTGEVVVSGRRPPTHDFNADGKSDIAWRDTSGNMAVWLMNGTAILNQNSSFVSNVPGQWGIVGERDFNGDGKADLLWRDTSGNVAIWEMNGTAVLNASSSFIANVPTNWSIVGTGDFNGDGKADILWQDSSGNVAIWEMDGTTVLSQNSSFVSNVPSQWSIKGTGDFNGDSKSDILWMDSSGNVAIWEMNGTAILNQSSSFVGTVPGQWTIKGTGDFNGDSMSDILWQELLRQCRDLGNERHRRLEPDQFVCCQRRRSMVDPAHRRLQRRRQV